MEYFETLPNHSPNIRISSYDIPLFGEFCLSNLLEPAALCPEAKYWLCVPSEGISKRLPGRSCCPHSVQSTRVQTLSVAFFRLSVPGLSVVPTYSLEAFQ